MHKVLRRAAGLLLVAGVVGLGGPAAAAPGGAAAPPSAGQAHLERMKVELAWLADLTCFGHALEAHVVGSGLEVRGCVPDEQTREHVVRVARQNSFLPVVDALRVTACPGAEPSASAEQLRQAAVRLLVQQCGARAAGFEVLAQEDGQVRVGGSVPSVEDKVAVSRCLRKLPGCTCVINRLSVVPTTHDGQTVTLVSTDGKQMVKGALPPFAGDGAGQPAAEDASPHLPRVTANVPGLYVPSGLPPVRGPQSATAVTSVAWYTGMTGPAAPPPGSPYCPACVREMDMSPPAKPPRFPLLARVGASLGMTPATPAAPAPTAYPAEPPAVTAPARPQRVVPVSAPQPPAAPAVYSAGSVSASRLQKAVQAACGSLATKVEIIMQRDRSLTVRVQASSPAAERQLVDRLMRVPEVVSPGVRLEVEVMP
jgi:hypothetical protein